MSDQPRSYQRSSSFQVTLLTFLLCSILLGSCLSSLALTFSSSSQPTLLPLLNAQSQLFVANDCRPSDDIWIELADTPITQPKVVVHPATSMRYFVHNVNCNNQNYTLGISAEWPLSNRDSHILLLILDVIVIILLMIIMYAIGRFVVNGTNRISSTARRIMATGDLTQRIKIDNRWDDLSESAATINELLARVEELMSGVKRVSDSIAHDLRTPLTRLRNDIEDVRRSEASDESLAILVEEVDQLIRTFNSLLRISRIETEQRRSHFSEFNLKTLLHDVGNFYSPLMEDKDIIFEEHLLDVSIYADKDLLFQALANILDNALKFTPEGGQIRLRCQVADTHCTMTISDTGGGIADEHLDKVLQRFYRADESRNPEGTGLGLALVGAVVQLHKGEISLNNDNLGLRVTIKLPLA